jgi:hypothetical protein
MMARHAAPDEDKSIDSNIVAPQQKSKSHIAFQDKFLPHWGFGIITGIYIGFNMAVGVAAVPPTISLGWTTTLGLWFHYLIKQRADSKEGNKND